MMSMFLLSMQIPVIQDIAIIFFIGLLILFIAQKLHIPGILAFLLTGLLIGPHGFGLISGLEEIEIMAEIGIVLLLFTIGMEFSIGSLKEIKKEVFDSLKVAGFDSSAIVNTNKMVVLLQDSINVLLANIKKLSSETSQLEATNSEFEKKKDSEAEYKEWVTNTTKLYESMESQKAAKIILKYSDNIAKDILYGMKKKKAAEILAEINPEIAKRITRVP